MPDVIQDKCDRLFALYDTDGNGHLDHEDVTLMVDRILAGSNVPADSPKAAALAAEYDAWWQSLLAHADVNGDGVITREEFRATMGGRALDDPALQGTVRKAVDAVFSALDSDDDHEIPASVLVAMFTRGGLSQDDATEAASVFDLDGDGTITREEYATRWLDFFTTDDPDSPANRILGNLA
ncbi:calcium-binding protein [Streptomyces spiroverticillatus]|uniref:Calcium-binding protein n=1 Tax=Streptomyces finlayi TaxID=67296 RepID=A0A918X098_9ACTN|nr:EF-hand domain-containing protein [Streptomyces finlayi]GHA17911.1 calcium-binding protein [Streptomyces spiroverticillatus]GHC99649.1 calcium-binding protein [Streptomyces finlayi]